MTMTETQAAAIANIAAGVDDLFSHPRTIATLEARGLVVRSGQGFRLTDDGQTALAEATARWPVLLGNWTGEAPSRGAGHDDVPMSG